MPRRPLLLLSVLLVIFPTIAESSESFQGRISFSRDDLKILKNNGFDFIDLEGGECLTIAGAPALPHTRVNVALPTGAEVQKVAIQSIRFVELGGAFNILPVAEPIHVGALPRDEPFRKDPSIYERNACFPGKYAELLGTWELVGQNFATLDLYPVQYNPASGKIRLALEIGFEVRYRIEEGAVRKTYNFNEKTRTHYQGRLKDLAFNPEDVETVPLYAGSILTSLEPGDYEYIIITSGAYYPLFQLLLDWRNGMGMPAKFVDPIWIYLQYPGATHQEKIRNFIIDAHAAWGAAYFLLGGDVNYIPCAWTQLCGENIPNDTYYSDYDGDWVCEVYVGRASVINADQVTRFVDKVLTYEKSPPAGYGSTVFFMGFDLDSATHSEGCKKAIKNLWIPPFASFDSEYDSESGGHIDDVIDNMNQGYNLINHIDHCGSDYIGIGCVNHGTGFGGGDAQNFTNGARYGNFYTLGCWPGNFPDTCWGEYYTRDDQGGITFVGNTRYGWYNPGLLNTLSHRYEKKWWRALYGENAYRAGDTLATSLNLYYPPDDLYKYIFTELNLLGDPGLHLWTNDPVDLDVTHSSNINNGSQTFSVLVESGAAPVEGALVCAMKDGEVYEYATTDAAGEVHLSIDPATAGDLKVTVTAQNFKCCESQAVVTHAPVISSITPRIGPEGGLTAVTVSGSNFTTDPPTMLRIGGKECLFIDVQSPDVLTAITPPGSDGWHDVEVDNGFGKSTLTQGYRYFPTGGLPFNALDTPGESINAPQDVTLIVSGPSTGSYSLFFSYDGGPVPTPFGIMGLDPPVMHVLSANLTALGYTLLPFNLVPGYGPLDLYLHVLGADKKGNVLWAFGGNNTNGSGSVWMHIKN